MPRRRLRQCYLGPSPQQTLCLVPRPPQQPPEALGKCYINMLPDELLVEILAYLPPTPDHDLWNPPSYEQCPPIALVCKRWESNYDTTLYRSISFVDSPKWRQDRTLKILEAVTQQEDLGDHVRDFSVQAWYMSKAACRKITDTIKSCQAIHSVSLHLGWSTKVWPIIRAIGMLPRLEVLRLSGYDSGPSLQMILGLFNQPTLRKVRLSRYGLSRGDTPRAPWLPIEPPTQDEMNKFSVVARSQSSAITALELEDPSSSPHCTSTFLQWPSKLTRLSLSQLLSSAYGLHYTLDAVELILSSHRESLQHITVSIITPRQNSHGDYITSGIPDFSKFPSLRELQLSSCNLLVERPPQAAAKLAAPVLRHLSIDFSTEAEPPESCSAFAEEQVLWMANFASQYPIREPNTRLQSIFVHFNPRIYNDVTERWPWEYLQQAQGELNRYNMTMRYSNPVRTKDEWEQVWRDYCKDIETCCDSQRIADDLQTLEVGDAAAQA